MLEINEQSKIHFYQIQSFIKTIWTTLWSNCATYRIYNKVFIIGSSKSKLYFSETVYFITAFSKLSLKSHIHLYCIVVFPQVQNLSVFSHLMSLIFLQPNCLELRNKDMSFLQQSNRLWNQESSRHLGCISGKHVKCIFSKNNKVTFTSQYFLFHS